MSDPGARGRTYIGLMSGTSIDGIDAALLRFGDRDCEVVAARTYAYPDSLRAALREMINEPKRCDVDDIGRLDRQVGECFRDATLKLMRECGADSSTVRAIGSHGQTIRHQPHADVPFTLQIGDPNVIAAGTGIDTIADFRRMDLALGGEGAPLASAFHAWLFADRDISRVILNLGGIANITVLPADGKAFGFDTGPGNTLMDAWTATHRGSRFDPDGRWAASGNSLDGLLADLLADAYFQLPPPKSTGLEYFNLDWLNKTGRQPAEADAGDVQATLALLTARSVANAVAEHAPAARELLVCGGGSKNGHLMTSIADLLPGLEVKSTTACGLHADWVEAAAFAWLAHRFLEGEAGNLPSVTGATRPAVLGALYAGAEQAQELA